MISEEPECLMVMNRQSMYRRIEAFQQQKKIENGHSNIMKFCSKIGG